MFNETPDDNPYPELHSIGDYKDELLEYIELSSRFPLVTVDAIQDGKIAVTLYDRNQPGFTYELWCQSAKDGLEWVAHLSEKTWITTEHLGIFARYLFDFYSGRTDLLPIVSKTVDAGSAAASTGGADGN